jgi:hypothetical protein
MLISSFDFIPEYYTTLTNLCFERLVEGCGSA